MKLKTLTIGILSLLLLYVVGCSDSHRHYHFIGPVIKCCECFDQDNGKGDGKGHDFHIHCDSLEVEEGDNG